MSSSGNSGPEQPLRMGAYKVVRRLGADAASRVYLGERAEGFQQRVALKVLGPMPSSGEEGQLLGSLDHPSIVRLLDQGTSAEGQSFLVMEYVDGLPIDNFCDERRLTIADRMQLLRKVMAAVTYAHSHLVVHADLKPANILVDRAGEPKLLDFGISRRTNDAEAAGVPQHTPAFASPEQRANGPATVSSDVYALGMIAALLLTGHVLSREEAASAVPVSAALRRHDDARVAALAEARRTSPAKLKRAVAGNLDAIVAKALQADPERRYSNVELFSNDLQAHLDSRPIAAMPATRPERIWKWVRRHRIVAATAGVLALAVVGSAVGISVQTARAERQRIAAEARLHELVRLTATLDGGLYASVQALPAAEKAKQVLLDGASGTLDQLAAESPDDAALAVEIAQQYERLARERLTSGVAPADALRRQALVDVDKAIVLLQRGTGSRAIGKQRADSLQSLRDLRKSLVS